MRPRIVCTPRRRLWFAAWRNQFEKYKTRQKSRIRFGSAAFFYFPIGLKCQPIDAKGRSIARSKRVPLRQQCNAAEDQGTGIDLLVPEQNKGDKDDGTKEKTAAVFVQNPTRTGVMELMYRTGDLGAYNDRGELMFLGRMDSQIKKQGYRIELGEIECALCAAPDVKAGCCFYDAQNEKIHAVYTGDAEEKPLLRAMKEKLPKYMLPDVFVKRDELPLTGNGKIDRVRLKKEVIG